MKKAKKPWIEVRDPDDEIWCSRGFVHVERMDSNFVWIGFSNGEEMVHLDLTAKGKIRMNVRDERRKAGG